jgi:serine/threonine protein kinase
MFIRGKFSEKVLPIITIYGKELVEEKQLYYAMEFAEMPLQTLFDYISKSDFRFELGIVIYLFVLRALLFLESIDVVHSDIKPDNFVIIDDPSSEYKINIKLIDFGTVKTLDMHRSKLLTRSINGTYAFLAPEAFSGIVHKKSDVWSLGIMLYVLIYDSFPDYVQNERSIQLFAISDREINFPANSDNRFQDLFFITKKCLTKSVEHRASASELYELSYRNSSDICNIIIKDTFVNNSKVKEIQNQYLIMKTNIRRAPAREQVNNFAQNANAPSQRKCFIRDCQAALPLNHQYNRCNNCFNTKCLDCYKKHTPGYKYKRCTECYSKFRRQN